MGYNQNSASHLNFDELKDVYRQYFGYTKEDDPGGNCRIRHVLACKQLVKEGSLKKAKKGKKGFRSVMLK